METVVKFEGVTEYVLDRLISLGYFRTKTEALRAGVLELAKEYNLLNNLEDLENEMAIRKAQKISLQIKAGKTKTTSLDQILNETGVKRKDLQ